jgi:hypothetical protein
MAAAYRQRIALKWWLIIVEPFLSNTWAVGLIQKRMREIIKRKSDIVVECKVNVRAFATRKGNPKDGNSNLTKGNGRLQPY